MRSGWPEAKRQQQLAALKGGVVGFFLWNVVIVAFHDVENSGYFFQTLGGFLLMLVLMMFFQGKYRVTDS